MVAVSDNDLKSAIKAFQSTAIQATLNTNRYRMRYFTCGSGIPLVFVHGMADSAKAFLMVMNRLSSRFQCIGYELPNGKTDGSSLSRYKLFDYSADLIALMDQLGIEKVAVVGSSFGSLIAIDALYRYPDRFTHAVLQNGFAHRPLSNWQWRAAIVGRFFPGWLADWPFLFETVLTRIEDSTFEQMSQVVADYFLIQGGHTPIHAVAMRALTIHKTNYLSQLPHLHIPILLLSGDRDRLVPPASRADLLQLLPNAREVIISNCSHYPQYTYPAQMAKSIEEFISPRVYSTD